MARSHSTRTRSFRRTPSNIWASFLTNAWNSISTLKCYAQVLFCAKSLFPMYAGRHLSATNRRKLIKQILKPSLLYAAPAWAGAIPSRKVRLRRGFSMAAKQILRLPRRHSTVHLYEAINMNVIESIIDESRAEMAARLLNTNAPNLVALAEDIHNTWLN